MSPIRSYAILSIFAPLLLLSSPTIDHDGIQLVASAFAQDDEGTTDAQEQPQDDEGATDAQEQPQDEGEPSAVEDAVPDTPQEAAETVSELVDAYDAKNWTLVFALGVMLFVYALRVTSLLDKLGLSSKALAWISLGVGLLTGVASALIAGLSWPAAIMEGVLIGLAGSGLWSSLGRKILPTKASSSDDAA